ncbi:ArsR/SmtB family transcription factor [Rhodothermus profundi]|uniref:Transcriptional regulator, ArsR family n=1 Tax=Rhodothermus profundi TaxID=633813 RepID=A0A1M6VT78_9BACT|nr:metalloregulator ArsR/SmtB family transcription factor [Rhodothermus profundi]SHK84621.1 transcriptional regulator, ArsR family [Rhodothermus profundi]
MSAIPDRLALKAKLFRGLADPARLSLLEALRAGPQTVTALVQATGLSQPNVSNHLRCLLDCGLVHRSRQGRFTIYQLSDPRIAELLQLAEQVLADIAAGIYHCTRYDAP